MLYDVPIREGQALILGRSAAALAWTCVVNHLHRLHTASRSGPPKTIGGYHRPAHGLVLLWFRSWRRTRGGLPQEVRGRPAGGRLRGLQPGWRGSPGSTPSRRRSAVLRPNEALLSIGSAPRPGATEGTCASISAGPARSARRVAKLVHRQSAQPSPTECDELNRAIFAPHFTAHSGHPVCGSSCSKVYPLPPWRARCDPHARPRHSFSLNSELGREVFIASRIAEVAG